MSNDIANNNQICNESMRSITKAKLIEDFGCYCMLCGEYFGEDITHHHIIWKSYGGDDSYENGSLLCWNCQSEVHSESFYSDKNQLINEILKNKKISILRKVDVYV